MRKNYKKLTSLILMLAMVISLIVPTDIVLAKTYDTLKVHYIDVGQGDATLITCGDDAMLIDAGNNNKGTTVQSYLLKQGVSALDYFIITHTDADHSGGADVIITKFDVEKVIYPDVTSDTATWRDVESAMKYKSYKRTNPVVGDTYNLGTATVTILGPKNTSYSDDNDTSVCVKITNGSTSYVFLGDAETEAQSDMINNSKIDLSADVLKIAHHGSSNGTSSTLLSAVDPSYAVISCGTGNSYGHPTTTVLGMLKSAGVKVFRTDEQGSVVSTSDGSSISWNTSPSTTWKAGSSGSKSDSGSATQSSANVKLNKSKATVKVGKKISLKITGTESKVTWISSNTKIAKVTSGGKVKGIKAGRATITAKVNGRKYKCTVTVKAAVTSSSNATNSPGLSDKETYVYITNTGSKYHALGCRYLNDSKTKITLSNAKSQGYTACKVCH